MASRMTIRFTVASLLLALSCQAKIKVKLNRSAKAAKTTTAASPSSVDKDVIVSTLGGTVTVPAGSYSPAADLVLKDSASADFVVAVGLPSTTPVVGGPLSFTSMLAGTTTQVDPIHAVNITLNVDTADSLGSDGAAIIYVTAASGLSYSFYVDHSKLSVKTDSGTGEKYVDVGYVTAGKFSVALVTGISRSVLEATYSALPTDGNVTVSIPTVSIGAPSAMFAKSGSTITYAVTYTGASTINLVDADISLTTTGTATATKTVTNGATATPTVTLTGFSGDGTIKISVAAGKSISSTRGVDLGAGPSTAVTDDNTSPLVPSISPSSATYTGSKVLTFSENATADPSFKEFRVTSTGTAPTSCTDGAASGASYTATGGVTQTVKIVACDQFGQMSTAASSTLTYAAPVTVSAVTSTKADGSYKVGEVIAVTVTFSGTVTVTGTPQITLETGTTDAVVNYTSGSPGTVLTFNYTVAAGQTSADLDYASTTALDFNGGTIQDAALNSATLTLVAPGAAGSIANGKAIVIDTTAPTVAFSSVSVSNPGSTLTPTILGTGSEASTVTGVRVFGWGWEVFLLNLEQIGFA